MKTGVERLGVNDLVEVSVSLSNDSQEVWLGYGDHPILLSYHWKRQDGSYVVYDGLRTKLRMGELAAGAVVEEKILVQAPNERGAYQLILTVVQEGVGWFEDKGFSSVSFEVMID